MTENSSIAKSSEAVKENSLEDFVDDIIGLQENIESLNQKVTPLKEEIANAKNQFESLKQEVATLKEEIANTNNQVDSLKQEIGSLKEELQHQPYPSVAVNKKNRLIINIRS